MLSILCGEADRQTSVRDGQLLRRIILGSQIGQIEENPTFHKEGSPGMQGGWLALGPFRFSKLGMVPLLAPLFGRNVPFGRSGGIEISMQEPDLSPCLRLSPLSGGQKTSKCEHSKNKINHAADRPKMLVV